MRCFAEAADRTDLWQKQLKGWNVRESQVANGFRAEGRAEALLEVLSEKFGTVPTELGDAIRGTTASDRLRAWLSAAVKAPTLDDFRRQAGL